jgi:hypothetical protein
MTEARPTDGVGPAERGTISTIEPGAGQLEELKRRLAVLEASHDRDAGAAPDLGDRAARPSHLEAHKASLTAHMQETFDTKWAPGAARSFQHDLETAGQDAGFSVLSVDCRMTSCTATVRFESYELARRQFGTLLRSPFQVNCHREVTLDPPPADPAAPFEATAFYDCTGVRAGDVP